MSATPNLGLAYLEEAQAHKEEWVNDAWDTLDARLAALVSANNGKLLGAGAAGVTTPITIGSGLTLSGGTLSADAASAGYINSTGTPGASDVAYWHDADTLASAGFAYTDIGRRSATNTWALAQTFSAAPNFASLTASRPVWLDSGKNATTPTTAQFLTDIGGQPLDADLTALAALATQGLVARTGAGAFATRTITGTADQVTVTNGDGIGGNPTLALPQGIAVTSSPTFTGLSLGNAPSSSTKTVASILGHASGNYGQSTETGVMSSLRISNNAASNVGVAAECVVVRGRNTVGAGAWIWRVASALGVLDDAMMLSHTGRLMLGNSAFFEATSGVGLLSVRSDTQHIRGENAAGTTTWEVLATGRLNLPVVGASTGILIGGDFLLHRHATDAGVGVIASGDSLQLDNLTAARPAWLDANKRLISPTTTQFLSDIGAVGLTGNETVAGIKTFSSAPVLSSLTASARIRTGAGKALESVTGDTIFSDAGLPVTFSTIDAMPAGADTSEGWVPVPFSPADGTTSMTFRIRGIRVQIVEGTTTNSATFIIEKSTDNGQTWSEIGGAANTSTTVASAARSGSKTSFSANAEFASGNLLRVSGSGGSGRAGIIVSLDCQRV